MGTASEAMRSIGRDPIFIERGEGAELTEEGPALAAMDLLGPVDVEEWAGGWAVACMGTNSVHWVPTSCRSTGVAVRDSLPGFSRPCGLACAPGLGLLVRDGGRQVAEDGTTTWGRLLVFACADDVAMAAMSEARVGWSVAVARAVLWRSG